MHRCKKRFFTFFIPVTFLRFLTFFYFVIRFIVYWKFHQDVREALLKLQNDLIGLYYESGWVHTAEQYVCSVYSDMAAMTSCSRHSQYVKSWIVTNWKCSLYLYFQLYCTYRIRHHIGQEVEHIRANVFYSTFLSVFYFVHVFYVF